MKQTTEVTLQSEMITIGQMVLIKTSTFSLTTETRGCEFTVCNLGVNTTEKPLRHMDEANH